EDLQTVAQLQQQGKWIEARSILNHGEERLAGSGRNDLQSRLQLAQHDLKMVERLEEVPLLRTMNVKDGEFDNPAADAAYQAVFAEYGLNMNGGDPNRLADAIRASALR